MRDHKLLAAGEWIETGSWSEVKGPYDGSAVGRVAQGDAALTAKAIAAAHNAFETAEFPQRCVDTLLFRATEARS